MAILLPSAEQLNALVVGASGGIGLGFVRSLLADRRVERVFGTYREKSRAAELFALRQRWPNRLTCLPLDVTVETDIAAAMRDVSELVGELHLALYCVGVLHGRGLAPEKSLTQVDADNMLYSFQVNSIGAVLVAKYAASLFHRKTPSIFAAISAKVGSIGDNRLGGWYGYRASKAALNLLMKTTAIEYGRRCPSTIVVTLHPGTTDTQLSKPFQARVPDEQLFTVTHTVKLLRGVLSKLEPADSGSFYSWNGSVLPGSRFWRRDFARLTISVVDVEDERVALCPLHVAMGDNQRTEERLPRRGFLLAQSHGDAKRPQTLSGCLRPAPYRPKRRLWRFCARKAAPTRAGVDPAKVYQRRLQEKHPSDPYPS